MAYVPVVETVRTDGMTIAFVRRGEGPPFVLLHGGMIDHREWDAQLQGLADRFTVIAWDTPGCGASSDPPSSFRMPDYGRTLASFVEALGVGPAHVGGLSWGSTLALELYRQRPHLVRSLVLTAAYAGWAGSLSSEEVASRLNGLLHDLDERPMDEWLREFLPTLVTDRAPEEMRASLLDAMTSASRGEGIRPMLHAMAEADLRAVLPTIAVPTLLLYGELDVRSPLAVAEEMQRTIPGSRLEILPGAGHQSNVETPDRFNEAVRRFLLEIEGGGEAG
jgi:pimeloyl-ACP methyl ester carboxylesterase